VAAEGGTAADLAGGAPDWRTAVPRILAVFIATRLVLVLLALFVDVSLPLDYDRPAYSHTPVLESLTGEDAVYYLGIAAEGYHLQPIKENHLDWAFFPLYPLVVRLASIVFLGNVAVAGVVVANLALLAALAALYRLSVRYMDSETALRAVAYLTIAPGAVAFGMAYTDSLFLLLAIGAFMAAERRQWLLMGVLYALATLTRPPGVLLGIPLAFFAIPAIRARNWFPALALVLGPLALVGFCAYLGLLTGDFLATFHAQAAWNIEPAIPLGGGGGGASGGSANPGIAPLPILLIATLVAYTFLFVYFRVDRIPLPYVALSVVSLLTLVGSLRLQSVARYLAVAWPFSWVLANRRAGWFVAAWPIFSMGLFVVHAVLNFTQALAP
jgi:hypothetical protein